MEQHPEITSSSHISIPEMFDHDYGLRKFGHISRPELFDHDYWCGSPNLPLGNGCGKDTFSEPERIGSGGNGDADITIDSGNWNIEDPAFRRFFVCHYCDNTWNDLSQLMVHLESSHPSVREVDAESLTIYNSGLSQAQSCPYCDWTAESFDLLVNHIGSCCRATSDYSCPHCGYRSMFKASLKDHMFKNHRNTCIYCILNVHA